MRPQKQKFLHDPNNGVFGDCYRTSLAVLLDMDRDDVPHFVTTMDESLWAAEVQPKFDAWLAGRGLIELAVAFTGDLEPVLQLQAATAGGMACMLNGMSASGCNHVVIVERGKIVCDPALNDSGIVGPTKQGYFWLTWLVPIDLSLVKSNKAIRRE